MGCGGVSICPAALLLAVKAVLLDATRPSRCKPAHLFASVLLYCWYNVLCICDVLPVEDKCSLTYASFKKKKTVLHFVPSFFSATTTLASR